MRRRDRAVALAVGLGFILCFVGLAFLVGYILGRVLL
jgi:hypothetical protein